MKKKKSFIKKKWNYFINIEKKRFRKMRLQTDQEFKQRNIKKLRRGEAFAAKQKIGELKKLLLRSTRIEKFKGKRIKPNELIKKAMFHINNTRSAKYGYSPKQIEEQALDPKTGKYFQEVYEFHHLMIKVKETKQKPNRKV